MPATLKPLPYSYESLEPTIGSQTVKLHHDKHQAGYVKGWNETVERLDRSRAKMSDGSLRDSYRSLAFNGAGVILHELYWDNLCPVGQSPAPSRAFVNAVTRDFGSFERMTHEMAGVGTAIRGSGWAVLAWVPAFQRMTILPVSEHQDNWIPGAIPLLVLDVWEHAYYLDYQSARNEYLNMIWNNVDWGVVSRRFGG